MSLIAAHFSVAANLSSEGFHRTASSPLLRHLANWKHSKLDDLALFSCGYALLDTTFENAAQFIN
jgi:hypothetical protein